MVLDTKQTVIAYRCPHCGKNVFSVVGVLALSGSLMKLKCDCGGSELTLERTGDGKLHLSVPCFLCPKPHRYALSPSLLAERDPFALGCSYSGVDLCFLGSKDRVLAATDRADAELARLMEEQQIPGFGAFAAARESDPIEKDAQVEDLVRFTVADLADEGKIRCNCPPGTPGEYTVEFLVDSALIYCKKCGATRMLPVSNTLTAQLFLEQDALDLRDTEGGE